MSLDPTERAAVAVRKFGKLGESEVITPKYICDAMVALVPDDGYTAAVENGHKILDIAGKAGEFALAIFKRFAALGYGIEQIRDTIYTVPTSGITYEFTRLIYETLGLNVENIAEKITAYDLMKIRKKITGDSKKGQDSKELDPEKIIDLLSRKKPFNELTLDDEITEGDEKVHFDVVVGNPPYQEIVSKASGNKSLGKQLFPSFIRLASKLGTRYSTLITPSKWFTSEGQDGSFAPLREFAKENNHFKVIRNFTNNAGIFEGVAFGAVNYYLYDPAYTGDVLFITDSTSNHRPLFEEDMDIILSMEQMVSIVNKVRSHEDFSSLMDLTCGRDAFGISGKQSFLDANTTAAPTGANNCSVRCAHEVIRYIEREKIVKNTDILEKWKIFTSKGNGAAGILETDRENSIIGKAYVGEPFSACSDSLIPIGRFDTETEAKNLVKYMKTRFLRFMVGVMKTSRNIYQVVYRFVPQQDFTDASDIDWSGSIAEIDAGLYRKYGLTPDEIAFIESTVKVME